MIASNKVIVKIEGNKIVRDITIISCFDVRTNDNGNGSRIILLKADMATGSKCVKLCRVSLSLDLVSLVFNVLGFKDSSDMIISKQVGSSLFLFFLKNF